MKLVIYMSLESEVGLMTSQVGGGGGGGGVASAPKAPSMAMGIVFLTTVVRSCVVRHIFTVHVHCTHTIFFM